MVTEEMGFGILPDPLKVNPETGLPTSTAQRAKEDAVAAQRANEATLLDEAVVTSNNIHDVAASVAIDLGTPALEGYDAKKEDGLFDNVPPEFHKRLAKADSPEEAWAVRAHIENYLENLDKLSASGWAGQSAMVAAGLVDADALLLPFSGGTIAGAKVASGLAKVGMTEGRVAGAITGAAAGAEAGLVVGAVGGAFGTVSDPGDIPLNLLSGMAFGATLGGVIGKGEITPDQQLNAARNVRDGYAKAREENFGYGSVVRADTGNASSARVRQAAPEGMRDSSKQWFDRAAEDGNATNARKVITGELDADTTNIDNLVGVYAQRAQNWVDKSPLRSLYTSVSDMGVIGNKIAFDLLNHPGGMLAGEAPPASLYDLMYHQELSVPVQNYHGLAMDYMNRPRDSFKQKATNLFVRKENYREFDRAVRLELESRYHDGAGSPDAHPAVKEMADHFDAMHARAVDMQRGKAGETPVNGAEALEAKSGYYQRRWSGEAIAKYDEGAVVNALSKSYMSLLPPGSVVNADDVKKIVKSIVTRAKAMDEGIDTNLVGLLRDGGKEFLRDTLKVNGLSDEAIDSLITAFVGNSAERAKPGFLKSRIELDMRVPIEGTDALLIDLLEPDLYKTTHKYIRKVAGTSALARKGYQLQDKTALIEAIKDEIFLSGKDANDPRIDDILETAFSYFGAGAVGKGVDPLVLSAMRLTRQSLLGTLGLTQMTELGNVVAAIGVEASMKMMPRELKSVLTGQKTPLVQELHDAFVFLDRDHVLHDDELALDIVGRDPVIQAKFVDGANKVIAFGDKLSGYTSLFYQSMTFSQRLALSGINHKLYKLLGSGEALDASTYRRLLDTGIDERLASSIQKYIDKGIIKTDDAGELGFNFNKWDPKDLEDYKLAMNMFTARVVQKQLPGEAPYWATTQFGQFMSQFRMFPIMALQKQALRQARHADSAAAAALLWNMGVAGIIYATSETVKGRGGDLTPERIAKGSLNYAPMTGWLPMAVDPIAEVMGMPELRMNQYGPPGRASEGIIPVPPAIPTLNRIAHIPGAAIGALNGVDRQEAVALSATPIIGNTYGFSALFNTLKDSD